MKFLLILIALINICLCIEESPIANAVCSMCSAGSSLANSFLPKGTTCNDLDIAMKNIGKPGCFGLVGSTNQTQINFNDPQEAHDAYDKLEKQYIAQSKKIVNLEISLFIVAILSIISIIILSYVIYRLRKIMKSPMKLYKNRK